MSRALFAAAMLAALPLGGCFGPNYARLNNELREKNLHLQQQLDQAQRQTADANATVAALQKQRDANAPPTPTLPADRLGLLYTVDSVELQSNSDAWDTHYTGHPDSFRVFVRPHAEDGTILPATGTLTVEAFDLAAEGASQRLGRWTFSPAQLKPLWYSQLGLNHFAVNCPWMIPTAGPGTQPAATTMAASAPADASSIPATGPAHAAITFKIEFTDALTGRVFQDQKLITIHMPATK